MFKKLGLYYRTVKHLKPIQFRYRLWYMFRNKIRNLTGCIYPLSIPKEGNILELTQGIQPPTSSFQPPKTFTFLNQSHAFEEAIDWNINRYGKLWAYNLNYFDYLHQPGITKKEGLKLIREFIDQIENNREGLEPYPISLRGINWIKFLSEYNIRDKDIDASLYGQYQILLDNLEYHLLGNHLLENGCSLLFGAYYFRDSNLYKEAEKILRSELDEQILADGGHFERSTMYHCIMLERLLDCYNVITGRSWLGDGELGRILREKVELMLGWLGEMTVDGRLLTENGKESFVNGPPPSVKELPLLNDAAKGIAPDPSELLNYADYLELDAKDITLGESGYRRLSTDTCNLICDVGNIGPDYQPGHAHSDTFSFVLYHQGKPLIIDPGISTYENNERRQLERSTAFHNTVQFENNDHTEVWNAFRVGRRAKVIKLEEDHSGENIKLCASHDGYKNWGIIHRRCWEINTKRNSIKIEDILKDDSVTPGFFYIHFDPRWSNEIIMKDNLIILNDIRIRFSNILHIERKKYDCPVGYNHYIKGVKIVAQFKGKMATHIELSP